MAGVDARVASAILLIQSKGGCMNIVNVAIGGVLQVVVFGIVPWVWWLVTARHKQSFLQWIGVRRPEAASRKRLYMGLLAVSVAFVVLSLLALWIIKSIPAAKIPFYGGGFAVLPAVIVYACINTALSEELLFRGFLLKRIAARWGYVAGNSVQAIVFGLLHGALFFTIVAWPVALMIVGVTGMIGWLSGYVNERLAGGSIVPSWAIHALANTIISMCAALTLV